MEVATLAPKAEVTIYPWKDSPAHIDEVVEARAAFPQGARAQDGTEVSR